MDLPDQVARPAAKSGPTSQIPSLDPLKVARSPAAIGPVPLVD